MDVQKYICIGTAYHAEKYQAQSIDTYHLDCLSLLRVPRL